jgi:glutamyl-tRNA(Gln) amidotransferase subunit E
MRRLSKVNYEEVGLKVGLEIHQQLDTKAKMFCNCPTKLSLGEPSKTVIRRLRPTQSELGQVDPAALFEFQRGRMVLYEIDNETSCLVEIDEEPPHELNREAIEASLLVSLLIRSTPVDEVHVMRKIVIDGSNTTGFQRTCIVAQGGSIDVDRATIPINQICLEEDAARKTGEEGLAVRYRLDRLGIPLVEVTTAPVIFSPSQAQEVALAIGRILRATRRVKRGLGTIRQDLNISLKEGALVEIKGVQKLELISVVVENEINRQLSLIRIRKELMSRGLVEDDLKKEFHDVTDLFKESSSRVIKEALKKNGVVLATRLPRFSGLLKTELEPGLRLGTEMSDRARFWGGVGGIFHTDELPAYGISEREVEELRSKLACRENDAVVIVADEHRNCRDALEAVVERSKEALRGVPDETRAANDDGTTRYMRPRPGAARMYPETDIPPIRVSQNWIEEVKAKLPPMPDVLIRQLMEEYKINKKLADQLVTSDYLEVFMVIMKSTSLAASFVATILTESIKNLEREGVQVESLSDRQLVETFQLVSQGVTAKESVQEVLIWLSKNPQSNPGEAIAELGLKMLSRKELEPMIQRKIEDNLSWIKEQGERAEGRLMGLVMGEVRGKADSKLVAEILRAKLAGVLGSTKSTV